MDESGSARVWKWLRRLLDAARRLYFLVKIGGPLLTAAITWAAVHVWSGLPWYLQGFLIASAFLFALGTMGWGARWLAMRLNRSLAERCEAPGDEIQRFLTDLGAFDWSSYGLETSAVSVAQNARARSTRLMDRYRERFQGRVSALVETLSSRGIHDEELERMAPHPTNPLGIERVAQRLAAVGARLRQL